MIKKIFTVGVVVLTIFWAVGLAAFVPIAQATTFSSGDLIKASLPAVYYYGADGKRYVFPNEPTYKTWYPDFSGVKTITDGELATIQIGGNVTDRPGVKLVKITTDPKVYAVAANGTLRWVTTASLAASLYGSNWGAMVLDVSDAFFVNYTIGAPINNVSDYSPSAATAAAQSINVDKGLAGISTTGGNLNVALASDTPASATVAAGASANMTKIILSAGSTATTVNSLYVTRSGLSSNDDILNIKLVGADGATVGTVASLGSNSKALVTFVPALQMAANTSLTLFIRASIANVGGISGNTVALSIAAASDVVLAAGTVTGAFPVSGNYMSVVVLAGLGSVIVDANALPPDSKPDAGAKRVQVSQFSVAAGPNEDLTVESLSLMEAGTASTADYANIELYSLTEARTLGTVASWDANARVVYGNLNIVVPKGAKHIFEVFSDVVGGSGNTLNVDLTDGKDALVVVKGNTYGFYLTPDITNTGSIAPIWDGKGKDQTVGKGILNVTKDISSPAAGNITQASEQALTTFAYEVRGEPAKITSTMITFAGTIAPAAVANAKLVDETGGVVAGPKAVTATWPNVTFTETYIVPTGTHKFTLKVDILSTAISGTNISARITNPSTGISATGINTRDDMTISAAPAAGNLQTVLGVALNVATLTQPASRAVSKGTQNFVWATASLDATNSGEDVRVTAATVNDVHVGAGDFTEIQNLSIWADLTSASSDRGDIFETKVSNNEQPIVATATKAISLTQVITVPKGSFIKIAVVGSLATNAPGTSNKISVSAVTASGKSTGNPPAVTYSGLGQVMTDVGAGVLTETLDASSPSAQILVSGTQKQTVAVFKLAANNVENLDLDQAIVTDIGGAGLNGAITAISLSSSAITGIVSAAGTVTVTAPGHTIPVGLTLNGTIAGAAYGTCNGTFALTTTGANTLTYVAPAGCVTSATAGTLTTEAVITSAGHGLATGDSVKLGGTDSTPAIDGGPDTITVLGANEFTVPVAAPITVVGTAGTWVKLNRGIGVGPVASAWYLYASARSDSGSTSDPIAVAAGGAVANFQLADNTVTIPANGSVTLTVKADVAPVDGVTVINTENLQAEILGVGDVLVTGKSSGLQTTGNPVTSAAVHTAMASRPYFSLNASSPSGTLVPSLVTLLGIFNVQADTADDISWDGTALPNVGTDTLGMELSDASGCIGNLVLKDEGGNTLDTIAGANGLNTFVFGTADFVVSKGTTKKLYVYGDASLCTISGNTLQVYFDSADAQNWSINYDAGGYNLGSIIFRGNLYANALVKG